MREFFDSEVSTSKTKTSCQHSSHSVHKKQSTSSSSHTSSSVDKVKSTPRSSDSACRTAKSAGSVQLTSKSSHNTTASSSSNTSSSADKKMSIPTSTQRITKVCSQSSHTSSSAGKVSIYKSSQTIFRHTSSSVDKEKSTPKSSDSACHTSSSAGKVQSTSKSSHNTTASSSSHTSSSADKKTSISTSSQSTTACSQSVNPAGNIPSSSLCNQSVTPAKDFNLTAYIFKQQTLAEKVQASKAKASVSMPVQVTALSKQACIAAKLHDPSMKLYALFVTKSLPIFDNANLFLQREEPAIHVVLSVLEDQLRQLMVRFVKPASILSASKMTEISFNDRKNQLEDEDLFVGEEVTAFINSADTLDRAAFYESVRRFYEEACRYMLKKFPYNDEMLYHARVADPNQRANVSFNSFKYFINQFPCLLPESTTVNQLQSEFLMYQIDCLTPSILSEERIDVVWHLISQLRNAVTGQLKFGNIASVIKGILTIYHSNADCERMFSMVRKNKTEFRSSMSTGTLSDLMTHKTMMLAKSQQCYTVKHCDDVLKKAKSAAYLCQQTQRSAETK